LPRGLGTGAGGAVRRWLSYLETVRELEDLSDRQLADLGLVRSDIRRFARQATRPPAIRASPRESRRGWESAER
jgi:uncharacterized protein YjiS (DUF1127 family)